MGKLIMDGHIVFDSTANAASWLHRTGQTRAADERSVGSNVNRAARDGGTAYGHTFERAAPPGR